MSDEPERICAKGHRTMRNLITVRDASGEVQRHAEFCGVCWAEWLESTFPVSNAESPATPERP